MEKIGDEKGICPHCKSEDVKHGGLIDSADEVFYQVRCNDCGEVWRETYNMEFIGNFDTA